MGEAEEDSGPACCSGTCWAAAVAETIGAGAAEAALAVVRMAAVASEASAEVTSEGVVRVVTGRRVWCRNTAWNRS